MKVQVVSDLHLEFGGYHGLYEIKKAKSDVLVIAGDLFVSKGSKRTLEIIDEIFEDRVVLFVPGNHEYYGESKNLIDKVFEKEYSGHLKILNPGVFEYGDIVFIGANGWWDGSYVPLNKTAIYGMNDFQVIKDIKENENGVAWGRKDREFFSFMLREHQSKKIVCISHTAPSPRCIRPRFVGSLLNACFANDWEDLIKTYRPKVWIHGHMHDSISFTIDKTKILCNPKGYTGYELNPGFDPGLVIEV